jgi:N6-adenosine-specific RNA methylase IME4
MNNPISVLVADPPWSFNDKLPGGGRGAEKHYTTLKLHELQRFPLPPLAEQVLLVLWRVGSQVEEAYQVVRAWGFVPKSEIVWVKTGAGIPPHVLDETEEAPPNGMLHMGMGHYVRNAHETAIVAVRSTIRGHFNVGDQACRSVIFAPIGEHSEKPPIFYELVERLGGAKATFGELFGRRPRAGWHVFGDEMPNGYVWTPREAPIELARCKGPGGSHRYGPRALPDGTRLCDDCSSPEPGEPLLAPGQGVVTVDAWASAQRHAEEEAEDADLDVEDFAELTKLPRHKVRRADGKIVPACCAACQLPQYASPSGVVCTNGHGGESSIPGCEFCGDAQGHRLECETLGLPTEPPPPPAAPPKPATLDEDFAALRPPVAALKAEKAAASKPLPTQPAAFVPEAKRDALLVRAKNDALLTDADLAEGPDAAWIKLLYRAPPNWFPPASWFERAPVSTTNGHPAPPGIEHMGKLARDLNAKGLYVSLVEVAAWTITRRDVARSWLDEGGTGTVPDWLSAYATPPAHAPECAKGCIGADAGCPAARHAWEEVLAREVRLPGKPANELERASTIPSPPPVHSDESATARADAKKRGRGRPPGAKNKPKDWWALAARATTQSEDPEFEEGFYS